MAIGVDDDNYLRFGTLEIDVQEEDEFTIDVEYGTTRFHQTQANPIGGRSAIIKLKWGESAKNLIYKNAPKFIKFALGENVKQSNWGKSCQSCRNASNYACTRR